MRNKTFIGVFVFIGLSAIVILGNTPKFLHQIIQSVEKSLTVSGVLQMDRENNSENNNSKIIPVVEKEKTLPSVPQDILWRMVFSLPQKLDREAEKLTGEGKDPTIWNTYLTRQAKLSIENEQILREIASRYNAETMPVDEKANEIIRQMRTKYPDGKIDKDNLPLPPTELGELQNQKNEITARYREDFKNAIGENSFKEFEVFLNGDFSKGISPIVLPTPNMNLVQGGTR